MNRALVIVPLLSALASAQAPSRANRALLESVLPMPPGGAALIPFGEKTDVSGVPMMVGVVETTRDGAEVLEFYAKLFDARGWPWSGIKQNLAASPWPSLSATLPDDLQATVMVLEREGGTSVVLSVSDMRLFYERVAKKAPDPGFPSPPNVKPSLLEIQGEGGGRVVTFSSTMTPVALEQFYAKRFGANWGQVLEQQHARHFELTNSGKRWRVRIQSREGGSQLSAIQLGGGAQ